MNYNESVDIFNVDVQLNFYGKLVKFVSELVFIMIRNFEYRKVSIFEQKYKSV